ncbi:MAG: Dam family site-specific DNA-(adenine-N6)-methyltransferase, partial [Vicinamibacterales bacterium]
MSAETSPRPFLKWAGGKRQLLPQLRRYYPARFGGYHEPFLGSGAVFFDLWNDGRLDGVPVRLTDENADLVGCYLRVADATDTVIAALRRLAAGHARGGAAHYYRVRVERFNPARAAWRAAGGGAAAYDPALAAMFLYLNRTGYNGLFRQNARGGFNVPAGRYERPRILDEPRLRAIARVLAAPNVQVAEAPFDLVAGHAEPGHFVYFDPPYAPLSPTARFRAYTARGFGDADQRRLQALAASLARRGV